ncbi:MAG: beta strand repeat-containing protein, partial [Lacibacter sp.]
GYAAWPTTGTVIKDFTVNNSNGVTLRDPRVVNGVLTLTSGKLAIGANTLTLAGTVASMTASNSLTGSASSNLTITGTGSLGTLFFDQTTPGTTNNIATLTLNRTSSGIAALGNDATIATSLTLTAGLLDLGAANLLIGGSASIGGSPSASNMVVATGAGQLRKTYGGTGTFTFPVGDNTSTAEYSPVTLNFTSGSFSSAYAGVNLVNAKYGSNSSATDFINRYWNVTTSGITSPVCTATFTYADGDIAGTEGNLFGGRYLSGAWNCMDAVNTGSNQISKTGITAFGDFTAGEGTSMNCITCANPTSGGTIAAAQTICNGATPAAFTSSALPTGHTGTLEYKWQSSTTSSSSGFSDIGSSNSTTYAPGALTVTTWFKRLSKVTCSGTWDVAAESNVLQVTVQSVPTAGTIGNAQTICTGGDPAAFTSTAAGTGDGTITYRWESAVSPFSSWSTIGGATSATYDPPSGLTATTQYRRYTVSTLNAVACESTSPTSAVEVTVNANLSVVTLSGTNNQTICSGSSGTSLSVSETGGGTITGRQWGYRTTSGGSITNISGQTGASYTPAAADLGGSGVRYIVCTSTPTCGSPTVSNEITITVNANLSAVALSPSTAQTVCISGSGTQLTASETGGGTITARQWGYRTVSGGSITNISGQTGATYTPAGSDLGGTGVRFIVCTSTPTCGSATVSNEVTVTVVSAGTWIGGASGNWTTGSNWCGGVPTSTTDVVIPSGVTVTVDGASSAKTVTNGGTLLGSSNTLTISGNFINNGTFTAGTGTIAFNATATVSGNATTFNNVTLSAAVNFGASLSTINGTLTINTGGSVSTNSPAYGGSSTLNYNQGGTVTQGLEWPTGSPQNVTITNNTRVDLDSDRSLAGNLTVTNGDLRALGAHTLTMNGTTQTITVSNTSGGKISGTNVGAGNDLSLVISGSSTTTLTGDASSTDDERTFFNVTVNTSGTLILSRGILCRFGTFTVNGTLQLNANGYVQSTNGQTPVYGNASTLVYNTGANPQGRAIEWSATGTGTIGTTVGYPNNVTISNNTTLNYPNGSPTVARGMEGTLTIGSGSSLFMDYGSPGTNASLTVKGAVNNSGSLSLGDAVGGDLFVGGNFTNNGTFTHKSRTVNFNGTTAQAISGSNLNSTGTTNCFPYLTINNSGGVSLSAAVTVTNTLTFTSGTLSLGSSNLTLTSGTTISGATSSRYVVTNGTGYLIQNVAGSEVTFPV